MKIHHLRNATFVIEAGENYILIDPMLSDEGAMPPFARTRHKSRRNPVVGLPDNVSEILSKVTHCMITHSQKFGLRRLQHTDHFDEVGEAFLKDKNIPVITRRQDVSYLKKYGLNVEASLKYWQPEETSVGKVIAVPAQHGHGWIHHLMANGAGLFLQPPGEPSVYISGDTVYTRDVERALNELKPDIAVVASGCASLDMGGPILMPMDEIITCIRKAPGRVVANHLEALNHCPMTREQLKEELEKHHRHDVE